MRSTNISPALRAGLIAAALWAAPAAADDAGPGIHPVAPGDVATQEAQYPPEARIGGFDGRYLEGLSYRAAGSDTNKVAVWESGPGSLRSHNYPLDEFVLVLEGTLVTTDADGTAREFGPGDTFIIPKGWNGTWDMTTRFRKLFVNF